MRAADAFIVGTTSVAARRVLRQLEGFFGGCPRRVTARCSASRSSSVVGVIDHLTGRRLSLAPFYLMPVLLVTWNAGPGVP